MTQQAPPPGPPPQGAPPQQWGPQPGWQPPKQGHKLRNLFLGCGGLVALLIVLVIAMNANSNSGTKVGTSNGATPSAGGGASGPQTFKIGDAIKVGDNTVSVVSVKALATSGNPYITPGPGKQYVLVGVSFANNGTQPSPVSSALSFSVHDSTGQTYEETFIPNQPQPPDGQVSPGDKLAGTLTYAVPAAQPLKLYYKNNLFSSGEVIVDLGTPKP